MKAVTYSQFGSPDVVRLSDVDRPSPGASELLVRIDAAVVSATDAIFRKGNPYIARLACGITKPKFAILGDILCGEVVETGDAVTRFRPGDCVYGSAGPALGAHAEYLCLPENAGLALKPASLSAAEAASLADGGLTALPFLRETARVQPGQTVLVNGAAGSIGSIAVQLARHFGAEVTGVCSSANVNLVESLGAHQVIDYTKQDFTRCTASYDVIFDTVGKSSFSRARRALRPGGLYMTTVLTAGIGFDMLRSKVLGDKKAAITFAGLRPAEKKSEYLAYFNDRVGEGVLKAIVDRCYPLEEAAEAHRHVDTGHKKGNVVLVMHGQGA